MSAKIALHNKQFQASSAIQAFDHAWTKIRDWDQLFWPLKMNSKIKNPSWTVS